MDDLREAFDEWFEKEWPHTNDLYYSGDTRSSQEKRFARIGFQAGAKHERDKTAWRDIKEKQAALDEREGVYKRALQKIYDDPELYEWERRNIAGEALNQQSEES
jgi:hypothetical protein